MPSVVPMPSSASWPEVRLSGVRAPRPRTARKASPVAMTTTLLRTGAHIGGAYRPRVFRIAPNTAPIP